MVGASDSWILLESSGVPAVEELPSPSTPSVTRFGLSQLLHKHKIEKIIQ